MNFRVETVWLFSNRSFCEIVDYKLRFVPFELYHFIAIIATQFPKTNRWEYRQKKVEKGKQRQILCGKACKYAALSEQKHAFHFLLQSNAFDNRRNMADLFSHIHIPNISHSIQVGIIYLLRREVSLWMKSSYLDNQTE